MEDCAALSAVGCANPPQPELSVYHIKMEEDFVQDFVYNFGTDISYVCEDEHFFKHDREVTNFTIKCLTTGEWAIPVEWKRCVKEEGAKLTLVI